MSSKRKLLISTAVVVVIVLVVGFWFRDDLYKLAFRPTDTTADQGARRSDSNSDSQPAVVADELEIPWSVVFLPDGELLVSERPGRLQRIDDNQTITVSGVEHVGEGGLLGVALHPEFDDNQLLYLYLTTRQPDGSLVNRVDRYRLADSQTPELRDKRTVLDGIPGASYHDGGRIKFGPDGLFYITTGDSGNAALAQDTDSLAGKILRIEPDGTIPESNPFDNEVYSYGHRNPQGLAWDDGDQLWSSEHGRSGLQTGFDELNKIEAGANYGWPEIEGDQTREGMVTPVLHSGPDETWAPASLAYSGGSFYFGGLRGVSLYEVRNADSGPQLTAHYRSEYGRLRDVTVGPDNQLYITTSNRDGRGTPGSGDDRIIRIDPTSLRSGI